MDWDYLRGFDGLSFAGMSNVTSMFHDEYLIHALKNNFVFTVVTVPVSMFIGLVIAVVLNKYVYGKSMLRTMFFLPHVGSMATVSVVWRVLYNTKEGPINSFIHALGFEKAPGWLASPHWALPAIMIMVVWLHIGYTMVLYMAGIQGIPKDLYEASEIDGAGWLHQFRDITLPMLKPTSFFLTVTLLISSFQVFAVVAVMTSGGPINSTMVISYHIYIQAFQNYKMGYAAAMSWFLFLLIFIVTMIQWRSQKKWQENF
ncbi:sugar ABC transporter permease [Paenibacillus sp. HB172176]|uniref:carbohydrate ABC transporter permease n=1 Tax=Paenibacillus sp. HB172176 TaxID=2493690 RepID=UPI001F0D9AC9|nr:sugar ABC transporter permease [Paenibacillus sp. HB172176]